MFTDQCILTPHQGKTSLQQTKTIREKHNQSKYRVAEPNPSEYIYT